MITKVLQSLTKNTKFNTSLLFQYSKLCAYIHVGKDSAGSTNVTVQMTHSRLPFFLNQKAF